MSCLFLLLWSVNVVGPSVTQTVIVKKDGTFVAKEIRTVSDDDLSQAHHLWVWGPDVPVRKVPPDRTRINEAQPGVPLMVSLVPPKSMKTLHGVRVVAAPVAMFNEIPEALLPHFPVTAEGFARLTVHSGETVRVRAYGGNLASPWYEVQAGGAAPELRLSPARPRTVRVLDSSGIPLRHGVVRVFVDDQPLWRGFVALYEVVEGQAALPELPDVPLGAVVMAKGAPPLLLRREIPPAATLGRGCFLAGKVEAENGNPVSGAKVEVSFLLHEQVPWRIVRSATSEDNGAFKVEELPLGKKVVRVSAPGFIPHRQAVDLTGPKLDLGVVRLRPGVFLPVFVKDERGQPIAGAVVSLDDDDPQFTDQHGQMLVEGLDPATEHQIRVTAAGFLPVARKIGTPIPSSVDLQLQRGVAVRGRALCAGHPAGGSYQLRLGSRSRYGSLPSDGLISLTLPANTAARLVVQPSGCRDRAVEIPPLPSGETYDLGEMDCESGSLVRFQVMGDDGQPAEGVRFWTPRPTAGGELVAWATGALVEATSNQEGWVNLSGLPPGHVLLRGDQEGFARLYMEVDVPEEGIQELPPVTLDRGREVRVRTVPSDAAETVRIDLRSTWEEMDWLTQPLKDGKATFAHVPTERKVLLSLWRSGEEVWTEEIIVPKGIRPVDVVVEVRPFRVRGCALLGERPVVGYLLFRRSSTRPQGVIFARPQTETAAQQAFGAGPSSISVLLDSEGCFEEMRLRPGRWEVVAKLLSGEITPPLEATLAESEEQEITLRFPGGKVHGRVVDEQGRGVGGATVRELGSGSFAMAGADGFFVISGLPLGQTRLVASSGERESEVKEVTVTPDAESQPAVLTLRPRNRREVVVNVLSDQRTGGFVFLQVEGGTTHMTTTDASGKAHFSLPLPLPPRVRAAAHIGGSWLLGPWQSLSSDDATLTLSPSCTGNLRLEVSADQAGAPVAIVSEDGWDLAMLFGLLGIPLRVGPEGRGSIFGLPEGQYGVSVSGMSGSVEVACGETKVLELR